MPVVGKLLKSSGAIFIRREWGNDELYKTVLEEYMATLLAEGSKYNKSVYSPIPKILTSTHMLQ